MKYGKLIEGAIQYAPNPLVYNRKRYANPRPVILIAAGYKPVYQDDYPSEDPNEGYYWDLTWTETDVAIFGHWVQVPIPVEPE